MNVRGELEVAASREALWRRLSDPRRLGGCPAGRVARR